MPFDPLDYRPSGPPPERPGPAAPTERHGATVLAAILLVAALLTALLDFPDALKAISRVADLLGL